MEKLITSTPSAMACSMAAMLSDAKQPPPSSVVDQQTLYIAMRARGAMPEIEPIAAAGPVTVTPELPPDVVEVWVPWPPQARADRYSYGKKCVMPASPPH